MTLSKESSNTINYLKCILCIGVVFIHCKFIPHESRLIGWVGWQCVDYQYFINFENIFSTLFLDKTCVPLFFVISGFLFFLNIPEKVKTCYFIDKIKSRIKSLFFPYIIANTIYIILTIINEKSISIDTLYLYWTPADPPLWYLRDLMVVCVFSPIIYLLIKKTNIILPLFLLCCWFFEIWPIHLRGLGIIGICFFTLGAWLSINRTDFISIIRGRKLWYIYTIVYSLLLMFAYWSQNKYLINISVLSSFPFLISVADIVSIAVNKTCPKFLITGTFFVFLYHYFYISSSTTRLLLFLGGTGIEMCFIAYFFGGTITIFLLLGIYYVLNKYLPRITSFLVGGR